MTTSNGTVPPAEDFTDDLARILGDNPSDGGDNPGDGDDDGSWEPNFQGLDAPYVGEESTESTETPSETESPAPESTTEAATEEELTTPLIPPEVQSKLDQYERDATERTERESQEKYERDEQQAVSKQQTFIDQEVQGDAKYWESIGLSPEHYQGRLEKYRGALEFAAGLSRKDKQMQTFYRDQATAAAKLSVEHGVPVDELLKYNRIEQMEGAVKGRSDSAKQTKRIANLEAEMKVLKGDKEAPAQAFETNSSQGSQSDAAFLKFTNELDRPLNSAELKRQARILGPLT